jgi:DNA-binding NarL/FixJ family response regulator
MVTPLRVLLFGGNGQLLKALIALIKSAPDMDVLGQPASNEDALVQTETGRPDVVLLAAQATAMDLALVRRLVNLPRPPFILVLVNEPEDLEMQAAIAAGVGGYLPVGTLPDGILDALRLAYHGRSLPGLVSALPDP